MHRSRLAENCRSLACDLAKGRRADGEIGRHELRMIQDALASTGHNQQQAAKVLGLSRQGLINKMKRYAIPG